MKSLMQRRKKKENNILTN